MVCQHFMVMANYFHSILAISTVTRSTHLLKKRDNPNLQNAPVIVGHAGGRGVVTTACYVARRYGVRSAMPMFKALRLCPQAVVISPNMSKYKVISQQIRSFMLELTPLIEPLSLDEADLDLSPGIRHDQTQSPAVLLAGLAKRVKREIGISISIGLADNKFLAKLASDMDKPRGFAAIGRRDAKAVLAPMPVSCIHGVGPASVRRLEAAGISHIEQLQKLSANELQTMFGKFGRRLAAYVHGEGPRSIATVRASKSISAETTFPIDKREPENLIAAAYGLCERVGDRLQKAGLAGGTLVLKLKTSDFRIQTRNLKLQTYTQRIDVLKKNTAHLVREACDGRSFRLIGVTGEADPPDLFDPATWQT